METTHSTMKRLISKAKKYKRDKKIGWILCLIDRSQTRAKNKKLLSALRIHVYGGEYFPYPTALMDVTIYQGWRERGHPL